MQRLPLLAVPVEFLPKFTNALLLLVGADRKWKGVEAFRLDPDGRGTEEAAGRKRPSYMASMGKNAKSVRIC